VNNFYEKSLFKTENYFRGCVLVRSFAAGAFCRFSSAVAIKPDQSQSNPIKVKNASSEV
jgi:hypothetical protein